MSHMCSNAIVSYQRSTSVYYFTPNLPTNVVGFGGLDSSTVLAMFGGVLLNESKSLEVLTQAILVGTMLVGRLCCYYIILYYITAYDYTLYHYD